ncbi:DMT family transporter [Kiloniella laminariae]|uniref:DMT family transporter n=1 Tax=Kiloniella laminariae TaxID=454162 RepID=A0ABT4LNT1_9PROT|nr:DMT family transporter [Kiloniella laminariae]MCZ4282802.1 DMT family transporter [Kiloniella laminariae]
MNTSILPFVAFVAGAAIAAQAALNSQLGLLLKNPIFATVVAFSASLVFTTLALVFTVRRVPDSSSLQSVPFYLWFTGGLLSAFAIASFYWLIPKIGAGSVVSAALTGQILLAMIAGHFGWFYLPVVPVTAVKLLGVALLVAGALLINKF